MSFHLTPPTLAMPMLTFLVIFLSTSLHSVISVPLTPTFCERSITRTTCPDPRTADHMILNAYMGTWYQVASTARYKLTYQSGLVCEQANYTLLSNNFGGGANHNFGGAASRVAAVNSGAAVISRPEAAALTRLSQPTDGICAAARTICQLTANPYSRLRQNVRNMWTSVNLLTASHPSIADNLRRQIRGMMHLVRLVDAGVDSLSSNVSRIQQTHVRISQDEGFRRQNILQLTEVVAGTLRAVRDLSYEIFSRDYLRRQILSQAAALAVENPSLAYQISSAAFQTAAEFAQVQSNLAQTAALLTNLEAGGANFRGRLGGPANSGGVPNIMYGLGFQNWSSPGKLQMDFYGLQSPYWVIGLEGSAMEEYRAAMVYWCREGLNGGIYEDLFVFSRSVEIENSVMERFMGIAASYGISMDCDNPLVFTDQRGGSCGAP